MSPKLLQNIAFFAFCAVSCKSSISVSTLNGVKPKDAEGVAAQSNSEEASEPNQTKSSSIIPPPEPFDLQKMESSPGKIIASWEPAVNADLYEVRLAQSADCSAPVQSDTTTETQYVFSGVTGGEYTICIDATNAAGKVRSISQTTEVKWQLPQSLIYTYSTSIYRFDIESKSNKKVFAENPTAYGGQYAFDVDPEGIVWIDRQGIQSVNLDGSDEKMLYPFTEFAGRVWDLERVGDNLYYSHDQSLFHYNINTKVHQKIFDAPTNLNGWFRGVAVDGGKLYANFTSYLSTVGGNFFPDSKVFRMDLNGANSEVLLVACPGPGNGCIYSTAGYVPWIEDILVYSGSMYISDQWGARVRRYDIATKAQTGSFKGTSFNFNEGLTLSDSNKLIRSGDGVLIKKDPGGTSTAFNSNTTGATYATSATDPMYYSKKVFEVGGYYYWIHRENSRIYRTHIATSQTVAITSPRSFPPKLSSLISVTFDPNRQVYFATDGFKIVEVPFDGLSFKVVYSLPVNTIQQVFFNPADHKIWWSEYSSGLIKKSNSDFTTQETAWDSGFSALNGFYIDQKAGKLYYARKLNSAGLHRVNLDGSNYQALSGVPTGPGSDTHNIFSILGIDKTSNLLVMGQDATGIVSIGPNGESPTKIINKNSVGWQGLAYDGDSLIYYADGKSIYSANSDGTDIQQLTDLLTIIPTRFEYFPGN